MKTKIGAKTSSAYARAKRSRRDRTFHETRNRQSREVGRQERMDLFDFPSSVSFNFTCFITVDSEAIVVGTELVPRRGGT